MTIARMFFQVLLLTLVLSAVLLGFSFVTERYYEALEEELTSQIEKVYQVNITHPGQDDKLETQIKSKIDSSRCYKVIVSDSIGRVREHRYYISSQIRALDQIGDHGRRTKRIIMDEDGRYRVTLYFNDREDIVLREYRDKNGRIVKRWRNDYLPIGGRTGY